MGQGAVELVDSRVGPAFNREIIPDMGLWSSARPESQYDQIYFDGSVERQVGLVFFSSGTARCAFTGELFTYLVNTTPSATAHSQRLRTLTRAHTFRHAVTSFFSTWLKVARLTLCV